MPGCWRTVDIAVCLSTLLFSLAAGIDSSQLVCQLLPHCDLTSITLPCPALPCCALSLQQLTLHLVTSVWWREMLCYRVYGTFPPPHSPRTFPPWLRLKRKKILANRISNHFPDRKLTSLASFSKVVLARGRMSEGKCLGGYPDLCITDVLLLMYWWSL